MVENAAYLKSGDLFGGLLDCDVPRVYTADSIVNTNATTRQLGDTRQYEKRRAMLAVFFCGWLIRVLQ